MFPCITLKTLVLRIYGRLFHLTINIDYSNLPSSVGKYKLHNSYVGLWPEQQNFSTADTSVFAEGSSGVKHDFGWNITVGTDSIFHIKLPTFWWNLRHYNCKEKKQSRYLQFTDFFSFTLLSNKFATVIWLFPFFPIAFI